MSDRTESAPAQAPQRRLPPVWELTISSYESVLRSWRDLLRALCLPVIVFAIVFVGGLVVPLIVHGHAGPWPVSGWSFLIPVGMIVVAVLHLLAVVSWHRRIALGHERSKPPLIPGWRMSTWRYLGYLLLFQLIFFVIAVVLLFLLFKPTLGTVVSPARQLDLWTFQLTGFALNLILVFVTALALSRLLLVLPAAAVQRPLSLGQSKAATKGNALRITASLWLVGVPVYLVTLMALPIGVLQQQEMMEAIRSGTLQPGQLPEISPSFYWIVTALNLVMLPVAYVAFFAAISLITRAHMILTGFQPAGIDAASSPH